MIQENSSKIIEDIAAYHNSEGRKHIFNWIRTCVTVLTPSLALLIGLQGIDLSGKYLTKYLLIASIFSMTTTILLGLLALHSEARGHVLARDEVIEAWNKNQKLEKIEKINILLPKKYLLALDCFPYSFSISILLLGAFGVSKFLLKI